MSLLTNLMAFGKFTNIMEWMNKQAYMTKTTSLEPSDTCSSSFLERQEIVQFHDKQKPRFSMISP